MNDQELLTAAVADSALLLTSACDLQAMMAAAREACRTDYREKEPNEYNVLRTIIDGQIALLSQRLSVPVEVSSARISYQIGILVSYTRSHYVINDLIMGGDVAEALTILRRQVESLARLNELDAHPLEHLLKRTPNVKNVLKESGKLYGFLSEVSHWSTPRVAELLTVVTEGDRVGPSLMPKYSDHVPAAFEAHWFIALLFLVWSNGALSQWYPNVDHSGDSRRVVTALLLAERSSIVQLSAFEVFAAEE